MEHPPTSPAQKVPRSTLSDCQRVVKVTNPAFALMGPVTFHDAFQVVGDPFAPWFQDVFLKKIFPALRAAVNFGATGRGDDLLQIDSTILIGATPLLSEGSGRAGRLLLGHGTPAGVRCLRKLTLAAEAGTTPGHFATVFAARCGIFSVGPQAATLAYLYQEMRLGAPDWTADFLEEKLLAAAQLIGSVLPSTAGWEPGAFVSGDPREHHG